MSLRNNKQNNTAGFTLMELVIVLAILAIIAAILIPTFMNATDRARLRSDIQSARVIHNAMELYRAERGRAVTGDMSAVIGHLREAGFLDDTQNISPQTEGAAWVVHNNRVVVNIAESPSGQGIVAGLSDDERLYVTGGGDG